MNCGSHHLNPECRSCPRLRRRILVVDDEAPVRLVVQTCLEMVGYWEVLAAASGQEGLERAGCEQPEAILLDVIMPGMDGFTFLYKLQESAVLSATPVIFLTATAHLVDLQQAKRLGVVGVIPKPFDPLTFVYQVDTLLHNFLMTFS